MYKIHEDNEKKREKKSSHALFQLISTSWLPFLSLLFFGLKYCDGVSSGNCFLNFWINQLQKNERKRSIMLWTVMNSTTACKAQPLFKENLLYFPTDAKCNVQNVDSSLAYVVYISARRWLKSAIKRCNPSHFNVRNNLALLPCKRNWKGLWKPRLVQITVNITWINTDEVVNVETALHCLNLQQK